MKSVLDLHSKGDISCPVEVHSNDPNGSIVAMSTAGTSGVNGNTQLLTVGNINVNALSRVAVLRCTLDN